MGTFSHPITLIASPGHPRGTIKAIVDTGATFTSVLAPLLERLGVSHERTVRLRLASGQIDERAVGEVRAELNGAQATIICLFGEEGTPPVIGAHTLEAFLLTADAVNRRLMPVEGRSL